MTISLIDLCKQDGITAVRPSLTDQSLTAGATCALTGSENLKLRYKLTVHLILPLTVDFDHNIIQYQFNIIQSSQALKRKREREKLRQFNTQVSLALNSTVVTAYGK